MTSTQSNPLSPNATNLNPRGEYACFAALPNTWFRRFLFQTGAGEDPGGGWVGEALTLIITLILTLTLI